MGNTDPANPWTNYTANSVVGQAAVDVQIQELGNSTSVIENGPPAPGSLTNTSQDPGAALSDCYTSATGTPGLNPESNQDIELWQNPEK